MQIKLFFISLLLLSSCLQILNQKISNSDSSSNHRVLGSATINNPHNHSRKTHFLYGAEQLKLREYYFDIPVVYNSKVKYWMNYFLNKGRPFFERYVERSGRFAPLMGDILEEQGLPRDLIFLAMAESGFNSKAKSRARAIGPWQFMSYTGRRYNLHIDWYIDERRDPIKSTKAAANYLTKLYNDFKSWSLAAAAYNAGEGKVSRAINRYRTDNFWNLTKRRYLRNETKNYIPKIMALAIIGKNLQSFGFNDIVFHEPFNYKLVTVGPMTDLYKVSDALDVDFDELQYLNPELLRWFTPPKKKYNLRIPVDNSSRWSVCCLNKNFTAKDFKTYIIKGNRSTLLSVARKFKIKSKDKYVLENLNNINSKIRLKRGTEVVLPFHKNHHLKHSLYADLYEPPRRSVIRRRKYRWRIRRAIKRGKQIKNPRYYIVKKGDSLWGISRKTGTPIDSLIVSNLNIIKRRMIRRGDKLKTN